MSPETEKEAQAAILRFFSENEIVPSPVDLKSRDFGRKLTLKTPTRIFNTTFEEPPKVTKDGKNQILFFF